MVALYNFCWKGTHVISVHISLTKASNMAGLICVGRGNMNLTQGATGATWDTPAVDEIYQ